MKASAILQAAIAVLLIIIPGFATAASGDDIRFYATGDPVYVSGSAPGAQTAGLDAWLFGPNYWSEESLDTESDGSYVYEIEGGITGSLSPGQYYVVIQHPMYNGVFDVTLQAGVPGAGQTSVVSAAGARFIVDGPGKLQGSAAAYALMNMLDSPDIDDTYTVTTFYLEEPWIKANDAGKYPVGSVVSLEGTTNIASGERLLYTFYPSSGDIPSSKQSEGTAYTTSMAGQVYVEYGMPANTWTVGIDTSGMDPGTYIFTIESVGTGNTAQKYVALYEPVVSPEMPGETVLPETASPAESASAEQTASAAGETPKAPGSVIPVLSALLVAAIFSAKGTISRRR